MNQTIERKQQQDNSARRDDRPWSVILWNDDYNSMDHVVVCVVRICNVSTETAVQHMLTAHKEGKANVKTCPFELAEAIREQLEMSGLTATIEKT